tara:strand:+ start:1036 stop:1260 length:225 start_codon:yes stop_codon:yes gene_type:complete
MTLDKIKLNQPVKVSKVHTEYVPTKFVQLGFIPGAVIALERPPSKNGLLYIVLDGFYIAITKEIAKKIEVEKIN